MIEECRGKDYEERIRILGLMKLETRRNRADLLEVFKILNGFEGIREEMFFKRYISSTRGHAMKLYKEGFNKDVLKFSFANRVIDKWNALPEDMIRARSLGA